MDIRHRSVLLVLFYIQDCISTGKISWCIDPLLNSNSVNNYHFWAVAQKTCSRGNGYAPNNRVTLGNGVFSMWSIPRRCKQGTKLVDNEFCMGICEDRT
jgi:hypothetical protein